MRQLNVRCMWTSEHTVWVPDDDEFTTYDWVGQIDSSEAELVDFEWFLAP